MNKEALTYAFSLLSIADRSASILFEKVEKRFDSASAAEVVKYLVENNFLNDSRYAKNLIENYSCLRRYGKNRIKLELIKKKIPKDIIETELSNIVDEETGCREAAANWLAKKSIVAELDYPTKNKLLAFLMRRGFDYETAKSGIEEALINTH